MKFILYTKNLGFSGHEAALPLIINFHIFVGPQGGSATDYINYVKDKVDYIC